MSSIETRIKKLESRTEAARVGIVFIVLANGQVRDNETGVIYADERAAAASGATTCIFIPHNGRDNDTGATYADDRAAVSGESVSVFIPDNGR